MKWKKLFLLRRYPYFLTILSLCLTTMFFYMRIGGPVEQEKPFQVLEDTSITNFVVDTPGCQIPDWDPWDPLVKHLFKPVVNPYFCEGQPSFLRVQPNGVINVDDTIMQYYYEIPPENVSCTYMPIYRDGKVEDFTIDFGHRYGPSRKLKFGMPLQDEFLKAECKFHGTNEPTFIEYLTLTPLKSRVESKKTVRRQNLNKLFNVMFIGVDSISRLQFLRHFPKCLNYLKGRASTFLLRGYNKVGDNTFPNLTPLLTGHFYQHYWDDTLNKTMFWDDVDFLWKKFSQKGYRTFFAEDAPDIATYDYYRSGFNHPPTDYYYRPFALAVENSESGLTNQYQCIGNKMEIQVIYDYLKNFVATMNHSRPFFSFSFLARMTHDVLNQAGYVDEPSFQLLRYLDELKITNNTVIVFFSDHGIRFGPIRETYIGQFEARMPFMYLIFPKWFSRKYPDLARNLRINEDRLTTPFDIHATMLDLLSFSDGISKEPVSSIDPPGISLFREMPVHRTCQSAWISPHFCTCQTQKVVSVDDDIIIRASTNVVDTINKWTQRLNHKCSTLKLEKIHNARVLKKLDTVSDRSNDSSGRNSYQVALMFDYIIVISTTPGSSLFEATVRCNNQTLSCDVFDEISRINRYGDQSACIDDVKLKKYCYCL